MKLLNHKVSREGDRVLVTAAFRDHMRRPVFVKVEVETASAEQSYVEGGVWKGDAKDVLGLFGGMGEIAWGMGWRPRGLIQTVAAMIEQFKIPKAE